MDVKESAYDSTLNRKVDVLWNIAGHARNAQCVQFALDNPNDIPRSIEKGPPTVARLNRCSDLKESCIVTWPSKGAYVSSSYVEILGQQATEGVSSCGNGFAQGRAWNSAKRCSLGLGLV